MKPKALISACLMGEHCRYDGKNKISKTLEKLKLEYDLIPVCPELLGGLSTPREKASLVKSDGSFADGASVLDGEARVRTESGRDVTQQFLEGAKIALAIAAGAADAADLAVNPLDKNNQVQTAFLKSRSPSCGLGKLSTPDGIKPGNGILAESLIRKGFRVIEMNE